jgi:prepilin-type N-terminal cleavage/methylation domain-containing protein
MSMKYKSHQKGFTLIELLVVISIIGLLSSIVLATTKSAKTKVEDTIISNDIRDYIIALDLYQLDHGGSYPSGSDGMPHCLGNKNPGGVCGIAGINTTQDVTLNNELYPYIPSLPSMITKKNYNNGDLTGYGYATGGSSYTLYYIVGVSKNCYGVTLSTDGINKYCYANPANNGSNASGS